jgi:hypothetical protein
VPELATSRAAIQITGDSRKKSVSESRIPSKLLKDVPCRGRAFEWNNREMFQQRDGLCQQLCAILRLPNRSNQATQAGLESGVILDNRCLQFLGNSPLLFCFCAQQLLT